jgi:hypothetical protein
MRVVQPFDRIYITEVEHPETARKILDVLGCEDTMDQDGVEPKSPPCILNPLLQPPRREISNGRGHRREKGAAGIDPSSATGQDLRDDIFTIFSKRLTLFQLLFGMRQTCHDNRVLLPEMLDHMKGPDFSAAVWGVREAVANEEDFHRRSKAGSGAV